LLYYTATEKEKALTVEKANWETSNKIENDQISPELFGVCQNQN